MRTTSWPGAVAAVVMIAPVVSGGELDDYLAACEALGYSGAAVVATFDEAGEGTVVVSAGYGVADRATGRRNTADTQFDIGSLAKQFTAALVLRLEELGELRTEETLGDFVADLSDDKAAITVHQLLTHTSGLPPDIRAGSATTERSELIRLVREAPLRTRPGAAWAYNNIGYCLLAALVEIRTGERYETLIKEHIFTPAGMTRTGFLGEAGHDPQRMAHGLIEPWKSRWGPALEGWYSWGLRGAGGILSTVEDLYRWEVALRTPDKVLSEASIERFFAAHVPTPHGASYGYGWHVTQLDGHRWYTHGGDTRGFAAKFYRFPEDDVFVAWVCNNAEPRHMIAVNLGRAAIGARYPKLPAPAAIDAETLAAWAGDYEGDQGSIKISVEHGRAVVYVTDARLPSATFIENPVPDGVDWDAAGKRLIEAVRANRPEDLEGILTKRFDRPRPWAPRLVKWLRSARDGELRGGTVIGTVVDNGRPVTWVSLRFDSGDFLIGMVWELGKDEVIGINDDRAADVHMGLLPVSATECIVWDREKGLQVGRLRRDDRAGPARRVTLAKPDDEFEYQRHVADR